MVEVIGSKSLFSVFGGERFIGYYCLFGAASGKTYQMVIRIYRINICVYFFLNIYANIFLYEVRGRS